MERIARIAWRPAGRERFETTASIEQWSQSSGPNVIPRRARPGLAGLRPHTMSEEATTLKVLRTCTCKPRPKPGLDCLMCAIVARQRLVGGTRLYWFQFRV